MTEKHEIMSKLGLKYSSFSEGTFTTTTAGSVQAVDDRPGLLVIVMLMFLVHVQCLVKFPSGN